MLTLFRMAGIHVVTNLHNTLWPAGFPPSSTSRRALSRLDGWFWRRWSFAALGCSPECERQVQMVTGRAIDFFQYRAQFDPAHFAGIPAPRHADRPFRVLFAGRCEAYKGVFDLLDIAELVRGRVPGGVLFELCGSGSAEHDLRAAIQSRALGDLVRFHGALKRPELLQCYARSHVVIVPTKSGFVEGLAMVAAEAVLCGRPVLTSRVVPALEILRPACLEARVDDPQDYARLLVELSSDPDLYATLCAASSGVSQQFVDRSRGLTCALSRMLERFLGGQPNSEVSTRVG